jgi:hypothetical protein
MRSAIAPLSAAFSLLLSGCVTTVPDMHANRVVDAAGKADLDAFRRELTPEARSTLGTPETMRTMEAELGHYTHVKVGPALLVARQRGDLGNGRIGDVRLDYRTTVAGSSRTGASRREIYTFLVRCTNHYETVHHTSQPDTCPRNEGPPESVCAVGSPAYDSLEFVQSCNVADIEK